MNMKKELGETKDENYNYQTLKFAPRIFDKLFLEKSRANNQINILMALTKRE